MKTLRYFVLVIAVSLCISLVPVSTSAQENHSVEVDNPAINAWIDAVSGGGTTGAEDFLAPDYIWYTNGFMSHVGPGGFRNWVAEIHALFPDVALTVEEVIAVNDTVALRYTLTGTHLGKDPQYPAEPTGNNLILSNVVIFHLDDNKIVDG